LVKFYTKGAQPLNGPQGLRWSLAEWSGATGRVATAPGDDPEREFRGKKAVTAVNSSRKARVDKESPGSLTAPGSATE
jgi:hypothetical protein